VLQETLPRGTQQPNSAQEPPQKHGCAGSRRQSRPNRTPQKDRKLAHTSPLGWKAQGARSRGEPRRCSKRHSRGAHNNQSALRSPPKNTVAQGAEDSRVRTEHLRKTENQPTLVPWDGRLRAHALGETQKVLQTTLSRVT